jgi:hypothetical protein
MAALGARLDRVRRALAPPRPRGGPAGYLPASAPSEAFLAAVAALDAFETASGSGSYAGPDSSRPDATAADTVEPPPVLAIDPERAVELEAIMARFRAG